MTPETVRRLKVNKRYQGSCCRWCGQMLLVGDDGAICGACDNPHHAHCWDQQNGCNGDQGCVNRPLQQLQYVAPVEQKPRLKPGESFCPTCGDVVSGYCFRCQTQSTSATEYRGPRETSSQAKEALRFAIIGLFCFGIVLGPLAIARGIEAKRTIAMNPRLEGEGLATAAQIIGSIEVLLFVGWILMGALASSSR